MTCADKYIVLAFQEVQSKCPWPVLAGVISVPPPSQSSKITYTTNLEGNIAISSISSEKTRTQYSTVTATASFNEEENSTSYCTSNESAMLVGK